MSEIAPTYTARSIDAKDYTQFVEEKVSRIFYNQLPNTLELDHLRGLKAELIGIYHQQELVHIAKISYLPELRMFERAQIHWLCQTPDLIEHLPGILPALETYLKARPRCLKLSICPIQVKKLHGASTVAEKQFSPLPAKKMAEIFKEANYQRLDYDFYTNPAVQPRYLYVKDIRNLSEEEVFADLNAKVRSHMRVCGHYNLKLRPLVPSEYKIFNQILLAMADNYGFPRQRVNLVSEAELAASGDNINYYAIYLNLAESLAYNAEMQKELEAELAACPGESRREKQTLHQLEQQIAANHKRRQQILEIQAQHPHQEELILGVTQYALSKSDYICLHTAIVDEFTYLSPAYRAHELLLKDAIARGADYYNFFAVSNPESPEDDAGVLRFKEQFNGYTEEHIGTFVKELRSPFLAKILAKIKDFKNHRL